MIGQLQQDGFAAASLCKVLEVQRSRYYAWRRGSQSQRAREDAKLKPLIREIFWEHKRRYGARRIAQELSSRQKCCGVGRVGRLLGEMELKAMVLDALRSAIALRGPGADLLHHTDRGGQYAGKEYRRVLQRAEMRQSMSRADSCYDNAFMESCFGTIKMELEMDCYESEAVARKEIGQYIRYYNTRRRHSALEYSTPEQFEATGEPSGDP